MRQHIRHRLALFITLAFTLTLAACSSKPTEAPRPAAGSQPAAGTAAPAPAPAPKQQLKVSVGRQPWAAGNSPIIQYALEKKLFEQYAADFGYELTVDYRDYPTALPQVEAMVGGSLDFGMWGNVPIIRNIAAGQKLSVLNVGEGHLRYVLVTREGSGVRSLADLKGKTVGLLLGGDPHAVLTNMVRGDLNTSLEGAGIKLVNMPTFAQAASVPKGVDATITYLPALLKAMQEDKAIKPVMNAYGLTEEYYKDARAEGAGKELPTVKASPFYPDGYYLHRSFWVVRNEILEKHPKVAVAFVMAQQKALEDLMKLPGEQVSELVKKYWELPPAAGKQIVQDEVLFLRGWVFPTEGDAWALVETSRFMADGKLIEKPLSWKEIQDNLKRTAPIVEAAHKALKGQVAVEAMAKDGAKDVRGYPTWLMDKWTRNK